MSSRTSRPNRSSGKSAAKASSKASNGAAHTEVAAMVLQTPLPH